MGRVFKLPEEMIKNGVYKDPDDFRVFLYLLVNSGNNGEVKTSIRKISKDLNIKKDRVHEILRQTKSQTIYRQFYRQFKGGIKVEDYRGFLESEDGTSDSFTDNLQTVLQTPDKNPPFFSNLDAYAHTRDNNNLNNNINNNNLIDNNNNNIYNIYNNINNLNYNLINNIINLLEEYKNNINNIKYKNNIQDEFNWIEELNITNKNNIKPRTSWIEEIKYNNKPREENVVVSHIDRGVWGESEHPADDPENFMAFYRSNINPVASMYELEKLTSWTDDVSPCLIKKACELAVEYNKRFYNYINAILMRCLEKGIKTRQQFEDAEKIRKEQAKSGGYNSQINGESEEDAEARRRDEEFWEQWEKRVREQNPTYLL